MKWNKKNFGIAVVILSVLTATVSLVAYLRIWGPNVTQDATTETYITIKKEDDFESLVRQLDSLNILNDTKSFRWVADLMDYPNNLKSGKYTYQKEMTNRELLTQLRNGSQVPINLTFNNQRNVQDLAGTFAKYIEADSIQILTALSDTSIIHQYGFDMATFPSMFVPNTYQLYWNTEPSELLDRFKSEYDKFWSDNNRSSKAKDLNLSQNEVSTLASIVEKESNIATEKPTIAGVYLNRLERGIKLQADPTVVFATGDFTIRRVLNKHLLTDSPYNTYMNYGLPPGPICVPSISSIDAVLIRQKHDYLYFCAKEGYNGEHRFAKTLSQHNANARRYQRWLNQEGIR